MAKDRATKAGGAKLNRSVTVTVRLDPKLRYLAELAARKQRRTVSSYIEWAIEESLQHVSINGLHGESSIATVANYLWDVDEADRFAKLANRYPDLLTHDEQVLWKLICENGFLWSGRYSPEWVWDTDDIDSLNFEKLRERWSDFVAVSKGEAQKDILPKWHRTDPDPAPTPAFKPDDDIPF